MLIKSRSNEKSSFKMLAKFQKHIQSNFPEIYSNKTLLAVSGGVDSMVLLHLFHALKLPFSVAHCNFNLRGKESDLDQVLVEKFCDDNKVNFYVNNVDTNSYVLQHKVSIQVAARDIRYLWFNELCVANNLSSIATAHHLDDQVETFLINFNRGTGIDGLTGIPERNGKIIRPLLPFSRNDILDYAIANDIVWREDASNATTKYQRNKYRHLVVPIFKELNSDFLNSFLQTQQNLKQTKELANDALSFFEERYVVIDRDVTKIDISIIKNKSLFLSYLQIYLKRFGFLSLTEIVKLIESSTGSVLKNSDYVVLKNRDELIISLVKPINLDFYTINNQKDFHNIGIECLIVDKNSDVIYSDKSTIFVDSEKLIFPMIFRKRIEGDVFQPFGLHGKKTITKFYKDEKLSLFDKEKQWLLVNGDNTIVWVVGLRADDRFKVTNQTKKIYKLTFNQ